LDIGIDLSSGVVIEPLMPDPKQSVLTFNVDQVNRDRYRFGRRERSVGKDASDCSLGSES
jgi:hypothetical protein